jgi:hypothetical protein
MAAVLTGSKVCETPGCNSAAKLQCPTCIKLGIQGSYFCSQVICTSMALNFPVYVDAETSWVNWKLDLVGLGLCILRKTSTCRRVVGEFSRQTVLTNLLICTRVDLPVIYKLIVYESDSLP